MTFIGQKNACADDLPSIPDNNSDSYLCRMNDLNYVRNSYHFKRDSALLYLQGVSSLFFERHPWCVEY